MRGWGEISNVTQVQESELSMFSKSLLDSGEDLFVNLRTVDM